MSERWRAVAGSAGLMAPDGSSRPTIFAEMTALAVQHGAANLGQGFPDEDGPEWIREAAVQAVRDGANQYPPGRGIPALRQAIAQHQRRHYGIELDPDTEVLVTAGATEAITAAVLALAGPGDEVVTLEPFYDCHAASIAMAGATHVTVPLVPREGNAGTAGNAGNGGIAGTGSNSGNAASAGDASTGGNGGFGVDLEALDTAIGERTRLVILNTPHNPTGTVLTGEELNAIAAAARRADAIVITDEVYEHLVFDGLAHTPIATLPGMAERTLTISSAGKTFSVTGWKIGWVTGPAELIEAVLAIKQYLTYSGGAPFQPAIARALVEGDPDIDALRTTLAERRDLLIDGLKGAGFEVVRPGGTYFVCADTTPFLTSEMPDGAAFARALPQLAGVACVPLSAFCHEASPTAQRLAPWVRFTFVKDEATLRTAIDRLRSL